MRNQKPLPREGSFKEYADNRPAGASKPRKRSFGGSDSKPDRRESRGNSFKDDRRNSSEPREMFDAVCAKCKKPCKVPFKPSTGRPVSCSDCFKPRDRDGGRGSFGGRDGGNRGFKPRTENQRFARTNSGERELFDAVCSKCNNKCKVPFKPTTGKPVSCSNCFVKREPSTGRGRPSFGGRNNDFKKKSFSRDSSRGRR